MTESPVLTTKKAVWLKKVPCHDCKAGPGQLHDAGCDVERCSRCGGQVISCGHGSEILGDPPNDAERMPWDGFWPFADLAIEYGFFTRWKDLPPTKHGPPGKWIKCEWDHPDAIPSGNELLERCEWDRASRKWVPT